jgi:hypothetical protein
MLCILWKRSITVRTAFDRRNLLLHTKQSEEANDRYKNSDRSPSRHVPIGTQALHCPYTQTGMITIDNLLKAIDRIRTSGYYDLLIGLFFPRYPTIIPAPLSSLPFEKFHRTGFHCHITCTSTISPTINRHYHHRRPLKTTN